MKTVPDLKNGGTKPNPQYEALLTKQGPSRVPGYSVADALSYWPSFATKAEADLAAINLQRAAVGQVKGDSSEPLRDIKSLYYELSGEEKAELRVWLQDQL